jgi:hypothetical protein
MAKEWKILLQTHIARYVLSNVYDQVCINRYFLRNIERSYEIKVVILHSLSLC